MTGIGLVTSLGGDRPSTWQNLLLNQSGIRLEANNVPLARVQQEFYGTPRVEACLSAAVKEAIADAQLNLPLPDCGLVIGTSRGYQAELEIRSGKNWLGLLSLGAAIAKLIQTQNTVLAPMAACATGNWAIFQAIDLIKSGQCDLAIAGAADAALTPLTLAGFAQLGVMAHKGLYPFSQERQGMVLGEGAAVLILESLTSARRRGVPSYGRVLGVGISNDGYHLTNFEPTFTQGAIAIYDCLRRSGLSGADIDYISPHGTGTLLNDAMEASLISQIFPHMPAIGATKGATGHALGATGMMEAAFCLLALQNHWLPPCVGLRSPAFNLNFVLQPAQTTIQTALNFNFGFGGQNSVVAFARS